MIPSGCKTCRRPCNECEWRRLVPRIHDAGILLLLWSDLHHLAIYVMTSLKATAIYRILATARLL